MCIIFIIVSQLRSVKVVQFDWLGDQVTQLVYWKCVLMEYGIECKETKLYTGNLRILKWFGFSANGEISVS